MFYEVWFNLQGFLVILENNTKWCKWKEKKRRWQVYFFSFLRKAQVGDTETHHKPTTLLSFSLCFLFFTSFSDKTVTNPLPFLSLPPSLSLSLSLSLSRTLSLPAFLFYFSCHSCSSFSLANIRMIQYNWYALKAYLLEELKLSSPWSFDSMEQLVNFIIRPPRYQFSSLPLSHPLHPNTFSNQTILFFSFQNSQMGYLLLLGVLCTLKAMEFNLKFWFLVLGKPQLSLGFRNWI